MLQDNVIFNGRFELISEEHDVSSFDCGATFLNEFLQSKALLETQQEHSHISSARPAVRSHWFLYASR